MYFIAAGDVTVVRDGNRFPLREGSFFGEMGLLDNRPRNADVISDGYSHLLMLHRRDFDRLLSARPEVRAEIEAVALKRAAPNSSPAGE
jgi:CPA1 family monovalent cation:H+ antiporter